MSVENKTVSNHFPLYKKGAEGESKARGMFNKTSPNPSFSKRGTNQNNYGIIVAGHGSRDPDGIREFEQLVALVKQRALQHVVTHGYLEFSSPTIDQAVTAQLAAGAQQVVMVPGVLLAAPGLSLLWWGSPPPTEPEFRPHPSQNCTQGV